MNPLLFLLKESRQLEDTPRDALAKLIFCINTYLDAPANAWMLHNICVGWELENGEPTYERLKAWCEEFAGTEEHQEIIRRLTEAHEKVIASLTDEEYFEAFGEKRDASG